MRIAVLGTGLASQLAALEIAETGHEADVHPTNRAAGGLGVIRLGYSCAGGAGLAVVRVLLRGAAAFRPLIERWTGPALFEDHGSADLLHVLPQGTALSADAARLHFAGVARLMADPGGAFAFGVESRGWRQLSPRELAGLFDTAHVAAAFATREFALDPEALHRTLDQAMRAQPRLRFRDDLTPRPPVPGRPDPAFDGYDAVIDTRPHEAPCTRPPSLLLSHQGETGPSPLPSVIRLGEASAGIVVFRDEVRILWPGPTRAADAIAALRQLAPGLTEHLAPPSHWTTQGVRVDFQEGWRTSGLLSQGRLHRLVAEEPTLAPLLAAEACRRVLATGANGV